MRNVILSPSVTVTAAGSELDLAITQCLDSVRVQQSLGLPSQCELVFTDPPPELIDQPPSPGSDLQVLVDGDVEPLFVGETTALELEYGPDNHQQLRLRGYDRLQRLRSSWSVRAHVQTSLRELVRELIDGLGVDLDAPSTGMTWPRVVQTDQSDFDLLVEMAGQLGLYPYLDGTSLRLLRLAGDGGSTELTLGQDLLEAQFEANADPDCESVSVSGWDPLRTEPFTGEASSPERGYDVDGWLSSHGTASGRRQELTDVAAINRDHLSAIARAHLEHRAARAVVFRGIADGRRALRPGSKIEISNVATQFAGTYTISSATHTIDSQRGFISALSTYPPTLRYGEQRARIGIGTVTQVDDPEGAGRVRVTFPTLGDVESEWLQVLSAGAGAGKGLMIVPDVNDVVLVLFAHGLPGQAIVLGGLYGMDGPEDAGVEGSRVARYTLRTPGGQVIRLDDGEQTLTFETADGNRIQLSPDLVSLHATTDLDIAAPGHRVSIRGQNIDFERS